MPRICSLDEADFAALQKPSTFAPRDLGSRGLQQTGED
jgi:hypothetical protein